MDSRELNLLIAQAAEESVEKVPQTTAPNPCTCEPASIAKYIDHTYLNPQASLDDIHRICAEAKEYHTASVCVNPCYIAFVAQELRGSDVTPCCVISFPFGASTPEAKSFEARDAAEKGAKEIDMVANIGAIKSGEWELVRRDIQGVVDAVGGIACVKVIIETCLLTDKEKVKVCAVAKLAGAHFVKTSTGFSSGGARVEDVALMRQTVGDALGVKASGGIHSYEEVCAMLSAGANRIGASATAKIISGPEA
mgnify:CR=1 FL=1